MANTKVIRARYTALGYSNKISPSKQKIKKTRALARISEPGVQKYTFGVNWVSNSFLSHCIIHKKIWILGCPKDTRTPFWLKAWISQNSSTDPMPLLCKMYVTEVYWEVSHGQRARVNELSISGKLCAGSLRGAGETIHLVKFLLVW